MKHEKPASKVAEMAQIQPKSQFLFHKNLPPRDFSIMTLHTPYTLLLSTPRFSYPPTALVWWVLVGVGESRAI